MSYVWGLRGGSGATGTNGWSDNDNEHIYDAVSWPGGNYDLNGNRICVVEAVNVNSPGGITGASVGSDGYARIFGGTPRINFNRNTAAGGGITSALSGYVWSGGLTGTFTWSTVAGAPTAISLVRTGRNVQVNISGSSDDGGQSITAYRVQRRESADGVSWGAWGDDQNISGGSYTYVALNPAKYHQFRTYAVNSRGNSQARESSVAYVPASGKRRASGVYANMTIAKRKVGGAWQDLSIGKRKASGAWVDLS